MMFEDIMFSVRGGIRVQEKNRAVRLLRQHHGRGSAPVGRGNSRFLIFIFRLVTT
jgi:hypothetical protein